MSRYVIQSLTTGCFLAASVDGEPEWVIPLTEAGVLDDVELLQQLIQDHTDPFHRVKVVDLSEL